jgi:hypothetical protein
MTTKKITRVRAWCDYCKKGIWSVKKMEVHEAHCTMNPNRVCRVCKTLLLQESTSLQELLAICKVAVPEPKTIGITGTVPESLHINLRRAAQKCPACEMAALRQSGIPCPAVPGFDFTAEMKAIWQDVNESKEYERE